MDGNFIIYVNKILLGSFTFPEILHILIIIELCKISGEVMLLINFPAIFFYQKWSSLLEDFLLYMNDKKFF
jgi:hypothetical protein